MRIVVSGCGKVGEQISRKLIQENHDISIVDTDENVVENLSNSIDVLGIVGNCASYEVLKEAGIEEADLMIAVTNSDEVNLLSCLIARQICGCNTIARVRNPIYSREIGLIKDELGLSMMVNPEYTAAIEIARILRFPSAIKVDTFAKGRAELLKFMVPEHSVMVGSTLIELQKKLNKNADVLVCTVERGSEAMIPNGSFVLEAGDVISIIASAENARKFFSWIGVEIHRVRNTMIVGGGTIAFYLARRLAQSGINCTIIEKDRRRCEELSEMLPNAVIINGDATDHELLLEEGIENVDSFVSLTGIDEANVFLSLYAKSCSQAKIITKVDRINYSRVIENFNLGSIIHPKNVTAEQVVRYVRAMENSAGSNVETLYNLIEDKVEALEFIIGEEAAGITGVPIAQLKREENTLIACISRGREIIIPNGRTTLNVGDSVVFVTTKKGVGEIGDLIGK